MTTEDLTKAVLRNIGRQIRKASGETPMHPNARGYKPSSPRFRPQSSAKLMRRRAANRTRNKRQRIARRANRR